MTAPGEVDPAILAARALQAGAVPPFDVTRLPSAEGRALANRAAAVLNDGLPWLPSVRTVDVAGPGGPLRVRIYRPERAHAGASILYIHGGGWFACDVDTHDRMLRALARDSGLCVTALDYRLAPEHPYPAALEDCLAVWRWLTARSAAHDIPAGRVAVAGDSAGANLALALALHQRDVDDRLPAGLALMYGCFAPGIATASQARYGTGGYGLTTARMGWYWANYLGAQAGDPPVTATPFHADLAKLPPVFVGIAECDILADENRMLAERLRAAGVPTEVDVWAGTTHGVLQMTGLAQSARDAVAAVARALVGFVAG